MIEFTCPTPHPSATASIINYSMYARTCTLLLTPPKPLFCSLGPAQIVSGSCGLYVHKGKTIEFMPEFTWPTPHPSATASPCIFFNLFIYCRLYKGVQDPVSFTVTTGLLGRLGLGLRRVSIGIIFTFFSEFIINLFRYCNKSRYERHLSNVSLND